MCCLTSSETASWAQKPCRRRTSSWRSGLRPDLHCQDERIHIKTPLHLQSMQPYIWFSYLGRYWPWVRSTWRALVPGRDVCEVNEGGDDDSDPALPTLVNQRKVKRYWHTLISTASQHTFEGVSPCSEWPPRAAGQCSASSLWPYRWCRSCPEEARGSPAIPCPESEETNPHAHL